MEIQLEQFENGKPLVLHGSDDLVKQINELKSKRKYKEVFALAQKMPLTAEKYLIACNALLHLKQWKKLIQYADKGIKVSEESEFYNLKGKAFGKLGDHDKKIEMITIAIKMNSEVGAYYRNLGAAYYSLQKYEKALMNHIKAIELEEENPINYHNIGAAYFRMNMYDQAKEAFQKAIIKNPQLALSYSWCGDCCNAQGLYKEALELYNRAFQLSGNPIYLKEKQRMDLHLKKINS